MRIRNLRKILHSPGLPFISLSHYYKEEFFYNEGGETLDQSAQRGGVCSIPGNIHDLAGPGFEQPDLAEVVPPHCKGIGLDDL